MIFRAGRIGKFGFRAWLVVVIAMAALASPAVAAAASTTLDFEGLAPGTQVSNQFDGLGIDFVNGVIGGSFNDLVYGDGVACYPVVTAVGAAAHSGTQVGDIGCADGEFACSIFTSSDWPKAAAGWGCICRMPLHCAVRSPRVRPCARRGAILQKSSLD